jgi:tetratricopeptide (TPR) repeat protein
MGAHETGLAIFYSIIFKMKAHSIITIALTTAFLWASHSIPTQAFFSVFTSVPEVPRVNSIDDFMRREAQIMASKDSDRRTQAILLSDRFSDYLAPDESSRGLVLEPLVKRYPKSTLLQLLSIKHLQTTTASSPQTIDRLYQQILQQYPDHPIAAEEYASYLGLQKRESEIKPLYEGLIQKQPKYLNHYIQLATFQNGSKGFFQVFDRATAAIPNEPLVYVQASEGFFLHALSQRSDDQSATAWHDRLKRGVKSMPQSPQLWGMLVSWEMRMNNPETAIVQANTAMKQVGEAGYFRMMLGDVELLFRKNPQAAIDHYQAAITAGGSFCVGDFAAQRVTELKKLGKKAIAIELAQRSLETPPTIQKIIPAASQESCDRTLAELNNVLPQPNN